MEEAEMKRSYISFMAVAGIMLGTLASARVHSMAPPPDPDDAPIAQAFFSKRLP
jgi:hypothetical protein